ncbi:DinB family protein [Micromonospora olivasterospora]|uniref:DinB family protein n=1 Tax=Micromonospora olivasterospora TaxID=1880 RepID=A0A562IGI8_MICOL|nr:DinB family protein [Micromonospora olivasterospora]TWH69936.1 DinB family protein [Micromonospora olivasterospora]
MPTIAWLTWHIGWWWSVATDHAEGRPARQRTEVGWPGEGATVGWLRDLRAGWLAYLDRLTDADLDAAASFPWPADSGHPVAHLLGWVNAELMKNAAEIGQLRLLRAAQAP